jgi:hypothetical protein
MKCSISCLNPEIRTKLERSNVKLGLKIVLFQKYVVEHIFEGVYSRNLPMYEIKA